MISPLEYLIKLNKDRPELNLGRIIALIQEGDIFEAINLLDFKINEVSNGLANQFLAIIDDLEKEID